MDYIYRMSTAGGMTSDTRYPNMLTNYGDFGALQRIAYQTSNGSVATITFNNIPQIYQDLFIVCFSRSGTTGNYTDLYVRLATGGGAVDSGSNYSTTRLYGDGASAVSDRFTNSNLIYCYPIPATSATSGVFASGITHILNYANSSTNKTVLSRGASDVNNAGYTAEQVGLWRNTGAITSVALLTNASFTTGSTFALYGIKASAA